MYLEKEKLVALVTAAQSGDNDALGELFTAFRDTFYYHALKNLDGNEDLALEVLQESFIEIFNTIGKLETPAAFVSWAKTIVYHQCTRYFKKKTDMTAYEDEEGNTIFDNVSEERSEFIPDEALDKDDFKATILSFISSLPEEQRAAVMMYYFDEIPVAEIAELQGLSTGTVKSRLNYARKGIKQQVEEYEKKNGIKLHSISILPLIKWVFDGAFSGGISEASAAALAEGVSAATGVTVTATTSAAATSAAATTAAATTATLGAKLAATPLGVKIISGILAASIVVGGSAAVIFGGDKDKDNPSSAPTISQPADDMQGQGEDKEHIHSFEEITQTKEFGVVNLSVTTKTCNCGQTATEMDDFSLIPMKNGYYEYLDRYFEAAWGNDGDFSIDGLFAAGDILVSAPYFDEGSIEISADEYYKELQKYFKLSDTVINEMKTQRPGDTYTVEFMYNGGHLMMENVVWLRDNIYRAFFNPSTSNIKHGDFYVDVEYNEHTGGENKIIAIKPYADAFYDPVRVHANYATARPEFAMDVAKTAMELSKINELKAFGGEGWNGSYLTAEDATMFYKTYQLLDVFGYNLYETETYGREFVGFNPQFNEDKLTSLTMSYYLPYDSDHSLEEERIMVAQKDMDKFISLAGGVSNVEAFIVDGETETAIEFDSITEDMIAEISGEWFGEKKIQLKTKAPLPLAAVGEYDLAYTFTSSNGFHYLAHNSELTITFN